MTFDEFKAKAKAEFEASVKQIYDRGFDAGRDAGLARAVEVAREHGTRGDAPIACVIECIERERGKP